VRGETLTCRACLMRLPMVAGQGTPLVHLFTLLVYRRQAGGAPFLCCTADPCVAHFCSWWADRLQRILGWDA